MKKEKPLSEVVKVDKLKLIMIIIGLIIGGVITFIWIT